MKITDLKNIMKEVNSPNEYTAVLVDTNHTLYWIWKFENVRIKTISPVIDEYRKNSARYDVFVNGLFISDDDYIVEGIDNDLYIRFIRDKFPEFDRFGEPYIIGQIDIVKIKGDVEQLN
jgi:hypothetical protein